MNKLIILVLLFLSTSLHAQTLYITYNPGDCLTCIRDLNESLKNLNKNIPVVILYSEDYKDDSASLKQKYLAHINYPLVFSDSLYKNLSDGRSTAIFLQSDKVNKVSRSLKVLNDNWIKEINQYYSDSFSINVEHSINGLLQSVGNNMYMLTGLEKRKIVAYDIFNNKKVSEYLITDSLLSENRNGIKIMNIKNQEELFVKHNIPAAGDIEQYVVDKDTLYVYSFRHFFRRKEDGDISYENYYGLDIFHKDGKLL